MKIYDVRAKTHDRREIYKVTKWLTFRSGRVMMSTDILHIVLYHKKDLLRSVWITFLLSRALNKFLR